MRFALMTEPQQGLSYDEHLAVVATRRGRRVRGASSAPTTTRASRAPPARRRPTPGPTRAGLARETSSIQLGVLVSPVTFRIAGQRSPRSSSTADEMSGGRVEVGVGAGWNEDEHRRLGLPFPEIGERAEQLEETLEILHGLWEEPDGWSFLGRHYAVEDAFFRPKPGDRAAGRDGGRPNIIIGVVRLAAGLPDRRPLRRRVQPLVDEPARCAATKFAALDEACQRDRARPVDAHPVRHGGRAHRPRRGTSCGAASAT